MDKPISSRLAIILYFVGMHKHVIMHVLVCVCDIV